MDAEIEMVALELRVLELLAHADKMRKHIESREFSHAALEAAGLELYCKGTNVLANRIADAT